MSDAIIEQVIGESENLALHVDICQQRYLQLINKFDLVDARLDTLNQLVRDIHGQVTNSRTAALETYLKWAGAIIMAFGGIITGLFMHLFMR